MSDVMEWAVRAEDVSVRYGRKVALESVGFSIRKGSVFAILGRNGAGKSSLVRCLIGQQRPDRGSVRVLGEDAWQKRFWLMDRIGIVAEEADGPPEMRVREVAAFCARLYSRWNEPSVQERLKRFEINPMQRMADLSKGQKKQVMLAIALAGSPEMVILDDPTLGLDVVARKSLFDEVISELADRGITIVVTTHDLTGVEGIADGVVMLRDGRVVLDEETESLKRRFRRIRYTAPALTLAGGGLQAVSVRSWGSGSEAVVTNFEEEALERLRSAAGVAEVTPMSLEDIFIAVTGEGSEEV